MEFSFSRTHCHLLDQCLEKNTDHLTSHHMVVTTATWTGKETETENAIETANESVNERENVRGRGIEIVTGKDM